MQLHNKSAALASRLSRAGQDFDNAESINLATQSLVHQRRKNYKQRAKRLIYHSNHMLLAFYCCCYLITQLNLSECKSTQLETEELHNISEEHQVKNLPEHDITGLSLESSIKSKTGCVCNEILCVMSHHNEDQNEGDSTEVATQFTRIIEARPPRQSPSNGRVKYGLNSIEYRVADATNRFGLLFLNNLGTTKGNTIYSPVSLQAILNMLYLGSERNSSTSRELSQGLGYDEFNLLGKEEPHQGLYNIYKDITDLLLPKIKDNESKRSNESSMIDAAGQSDRSIESSRSEEGPSSAQLNFTMTNLLLTNKNLVDINEEYHSTLDKFYKVKLAQFKRISASNESSSVSNKNSLNLSSPDPVVLEVENDKQLADTINSWVSENTNHKIDKLVEEKDVPLNDLVLALVNSAHFQASWLDKFDESQTRDGYFFNEGRDDDKKLTPFMRKTSDFGYAQFVPKPQDQDVAKGETINSTLQQQQQQGAIEAPDLDCQALEIPFSIGQGKELSMLILLPRQRQGLDKLQRSLTWSTLRGIYNALEEEKVQLELPKFTFEESYDVKKILERMGIRSVFDPSRAKLTEMLVPKETKGIGNGVTFSVDKILHKAKVEVHESGAEAAASTYAGVLLRASLYVRPTPKFIAEHPFIFIIRHNKSNLPLFMGRVNQF